jgi:D-beta-D-heptose 7-phosphate kinase / D-beta-D-heptose 1-phosphate adenosyltransferase
MMAPGNGDPISTIDGFAQRKLLVIGEAMLDSYLSGVSTRLNREAPVPIVDIQERVYVPGGAANTAVNLRSLGASVALLSVIGADEDGAHLMSALEQSGVPTEHVLQESGRATLSKQRIMAGSHMIVRVDQGTTSPAGPDVESRLIARLVRLFLESDAVVISDYDYGVITPRVLSTLEKLQKEHPHLIIVDSKRLGAYKTLNVTAVKPNYEEALQLLGLEKQPDDEGRVRQLEKAGRRLLDVTGARIAAITLDHSGALIFRAGDETPYRTYAKPEPNSRAAGAGDTFVSALAASLAGGVALEHAAEIASAAASIVVAKNGTAACQAEELKGYFSTHEKFISDIFQLALRVTYYRRSGHKIVFTNGCFDILHSGHTAYLNRAKALGDILIVGLNSDDSVRRLKGPSRPINTLDDRAQVLAALSCVDHIVSFDSDTPHELIRMIRPDVFVKGGDYTRQTLGEAGLVEEQGGRVEILPYLAEYSTTGVIEKIRNIFMDEMASDGGSGQGSENTTHDL